MSRADSPTEDVPERAGAATVNRTEGGELLGAVAHLSADDLERLGIGADVDVLRYWVDAGGRIRAVPGGVRHD